ncbi:MULTISPECIES: DUF805 domain-containing protein [Brevibacterium]|uniref:DUF805 domain-containing protein n=1 Tax=Brevibacterium casei TaxID=33889 RepID=A0A7T4DJE3_9MICO|nr:MULTISPECIES: DUF805 domain-containing protein [Brevibacterium]QQB14738.1 DUF805 domain-containing protein [Brevibacterium casei]
MTDDANNAYGSGAENAPGAGYGTGAAFGADLDGAKSPDDLSRPLYGATFGQAVRRFWKKFSVFSGRASRSEYWFAYLFQALVMLIPAILWIVGLSMTAATAASSSYSPYGTPTAEPNPAGATLALIGGILLFIIALAFLVPNLAISWRRLHDANLAGPFWFLNLIPSVGSLIVLVLMILPSKPEGRRFDT